MDTQYLSKTGAVQSGDPLLYAKQDPDRVMLELDRIEIGHPHGAGSVGRHAPVAARGEVDGTDLDAVRHDVALELLAEKALIKQTQRLENFFWIRIGESMAGQI